MTRLFLSVPVPDHVEDGLFALQEGFPTARWTDPGHHHVTLLFLGEVPDHLQEPLHARLTAIHHESFELAIRGVGHFPPRGPVRSLWAGLVASEPLIRLQHKLVKAVQGLDIPVDSRKFAPHVTLGRVREPAVERVMAWLVAWQGQASPPWRVEEFLLMRSQPGPDGSDYSVVAVYPLDRADH